MNSRTIGLIVAALCTVPLVVPAADSPASCPLTATQQVNAVQAWRKMMPVLRHPRCLNCHGGIPNPFAAPFPATEPPRRHVGVVDIERSMHLDVCENCHMKGWEMPHWSMFWTDKTDVQVCNLMKNRFSAVRFVDHMRRDQGGIQFIKAGFEGKRSLDAGGQAIYEAETGRTFRADPPPGTQEQLTQQAQDWVDAQGGTFVGDDDCGCVVDRMEILFRSTLKVVSGDRLKETSTITGEGRIVLKLGPELSAPEWDVATGVQGEKAKIGWSNVAVTKTNGCTVSFRSNPDTEFKFWLGMSLTPKPKFSLEIVPGVDRHETVNRCPNPLTGALITSPMNDPTVGMFMGTWMALHGQAVPGSVSLTDLRKAPAADPKAFGMPDLANFDPKALAAMVEAMKGKPPAEAAAEMMQLMNQLVPGASQMAATARNNFRFTIPDGKSCSLATGTDFLAYCRFTRTISIPDIRGGMQSITESTTISIGKPKS
jgi:hypothetical protein